MTKLLKSIAEKAALSGLFYNEPKSVCLHFNSNSQLKFAGGPLFLGTKILNVLVALFPNVATLTEKCNPKLVLVLLFSTA